ncbi:MAG: 50S ribosomal protein L15 [Opitutales bacterium]|nr:50S ribosomal protein L15 [Opitutales bacterium]
MKLHDLIKVGTNRATKRRGRGSASGVGGTSGRGHKGGKARSGYSPAPCCSGLPYYRRLPKRGFKNGAFGQDFIAVNVDTLAHLDCAEITREVLVERGVVRTSESLIKVLGRGEITKAIRVVADQFSEAARRKIEAAGGTVEALAVR